MTSLSEDPVVSNIVLIMLERTAKKNIVASCIPQRGIILRKCEKGYLVAELGAFADFCGITCLEQLTL